MIVAYGSSICIIFHIPIFLSVQQSFFSRRDLRQAASSTICKILFSTEINSLIQKHLQLSFAQWKPLEDCNSGDHHTNGQQVAGKDQFYAINQVSPPPPHTPSPRQLHCLNSVPYLGAHSKECHFSRETMAKCNFKDKENRAAMFCTKCVHIQVNKRYKEKSPVSQRQIHKKPPVFVGRIGTFVNRSAFLFVRNINIFSWLMHRFFFFFFSSSNVAILALFVGQAQNSPWNRRLQL